MRRRAPASLALSLALTVAGTVSAAALSLPVEEYVYLPQEETTTYVERSLNRQAPLTIEHPPLERGPTGRGAGRDSAAMAGFCQSGGMIRRRDEDGRPVILREREVCENVAPRQLWPGHVDWRPYWRPRPVINRQRRLVTKG